MTDGGSKRRFEFSGWAGVLITSIAALVAITVQWGVVTTKLDNLEKRLDEMIFETRSMRNEYQDIQRRLATLEGMHQAPGNPGGKANP